MIHLRSDYDSIQDPSGKIGEKEPVFLLRAKDVLAPCIVRKWAENLSRNGGEPELVARVMEWAALMEEWQVDNGTKVPDVEAKYMKDVDDIEL